ncbi:MAG: 4Fe-4S binding protein [Coriobacteriales bacterium]|jgi:pyruvate ferredoxin oxidoreductase delta subunit|nr:4Fe-4S binding protein [Coriobacteriales bacterium]
MTQTQASKTHTDVANFDRWTSSCFLPGAVVIDPGNSVLYATGGWRSDRPVWNEEACTNCMLCWVHCPDSSILVEDRIMTGIDYEHCKGCGICANECRFDALEMILEPDPLSEQAGAPVKGGN